ncbi:amino acid ABC transporter permease [Cereibacter changlensis]|uniref:Amino acid ABC transporter permease n=2 Tax=Cereibacter changlensis TaxID=402884 RepID=A0A2T4JTZ0_9RHOB|nr:ABC transporter permease subunit [Cereibacter changlensis]PTE21382.1 amino acid ABC transporter permease [Cereibacter changlensis JA139]PZX58591.1 L-glutamine ABC transporter membrane protein /L-glutamate ABC transporter membrane protein /L-aspartate ABC transporter membrane protein /L-asparagine ABC transporter membrane protein [Cereibacter changlensis]
MANVADVPKPSFRLSMLLYDTRYRSLTIQIVVFLLVMAGAAWLVDNTIRNLQALGKDFNFSFLGARAGYDISQRLVEYTNDSTHGRALLIGLLNTLLVAFLGCIAATVIGVLVGVLRLSKNWLIARLMTVYVEIFRNIPLLLWILLIYAVFTEAAPAPNAFRVNAETGEAATSMFLDAFAVTNRYTAIPNPVFGLDLGWLNIGLFYVSVDFLLLVAAIVVGFFLNRMALRRATRIQEATGDRPTTWWQSLLLLVGIPVAALIAMGFHFEFPELKGFNFTGGLNVSNSFMALWLALSLYTGAFIAEIVRAGVLAISKGQSEAAFALGLRPARTMNLVILPQALRVIIPPLISQYLNLTKNSSLAIAVGYLDLRGTLGGITLNQTGRELECVLLMMLIYLTISLIISGLMNVYNASVKLKER